MSYIAFPEEDLYYYGELPEAGGTSKSYDLSKSNIPGTAKEILVYLWATTVGDEAFHRYYYRIQTTDGTNKYNQYMNAAASTDVSLNSANLWLPVFQNHGQVLVELVDTSPTAKGKSIAHRCRVKRTKRGKEEVITFSEFFVLGYR